VRTVTGDTARRASETLKPTSCPGSYRAEAMGLAGLAKPSDEFLRYPPLLRDTS
jgi:hypothetical protein